MEMEADFVAVARGMLTDPHFARKALAGSGGEILRCIECRPCTYMRDSRCPDDAYPGGVPDSMKAIVDAASKMKSGGYAPTAKKRARGDDAVGEEPEGSAVS
jgi:hypothetical protein